MELGTLSPDIDARFCYLIVMLAGMLTAVREVDRRLARIPGAWSDAGAHRLFAFLWVTPVVLFFLLDHFGAINDTSPLAALVVAVTYSALLAGSGRGALPSQVGDFWARLLGDVDRIQATAQARLQSRVLDYARGVIRDIAGKGTRYNRLLALARRLVADPQALDAMLAGIDQQYAEDATLATWKKSEALIRVLNGVSVSRGVSDEVHDMLRREGLISWRTYSHFPRGHIGDSRRTLSVLVPAGVIAALAVLSTTDRWNFERGWLDWRLSKANATAVDLTRTREALIERFARSEKPEQELSALGSTLREAGMTPSRVDAAIGIMTDGVRQRGDRERLMPELIVTLIVSLRTANVDARARVHSALIYLADLRLKGAAENKDAVAALDALRKWKPSESDSVPVLAARIDEWRRLFILVK